MTITITWYDITNDIPHATAVQYNVTFSIAADPVTPSNLYVSSGGLGGGSAGTIWRSVDGGANWLTENNFATRIIVDPLSPNNVYVYTTDLLNHVLYKSIDYGVSFTDLHPGVDPIYKLSFVDDLGYVYVIAGFRFGLNVVQISRDEGATWTGKSGPGGGLAQTLTDLQPAPSDGTLWYFLQANSIGSSNNYGVGWTYIHAFPGLTTVLTAMAIDPDNSGIIYVIHKQTDVDPPNAAHYKIYKTYDGGSNWAELTSGLPSPDTTAYTSLVIDKQYPNIVYLGTLGEGVFISEDSGDTWAQYNSGLTDLNVQTMTFNNTGRNLYAGTSTGIFTTGVPVTAGLRLRAIFWN